MEVFIKENGYCLGTEGSWKVWACARDNTFPPLTFVGQSSIPHRYPPPTFDGSDGLPRTRTAPTDARNLPTDHARTHAECNFVKTTAGSTYQSKTLDKFVYKPRTDDEYFEALARGGQKSEVCVCAVDVDKPSITNPHTILDISPAGSNELHHHRYSRYPTVPNWTAPRRPPGLGTRNSTRRRR